MGDAVPLSDVLYALRASKVVLVAVDTKIHRYILSAPGVDPEEHTFTDPVGKRDLQYLARKYDV
jgi:hypothetical protein